MPVHKGEDAKGPYFQWGHSGKKYHYKTHAGKLKAKEKARKQGEAIKARQSGGASHIQSVMFDRNKYTLEQAKKELHHMGFKTTFHHKLIDVTPHEYRFRQMAPDEEKYRYRIKQVHPGIKLVIAFNK